MIHLNQNVYKIRSACDYSEETESDMAVRLKANEFFFFIFFGTNFGFD